ncbi:MAG TPA: hypothetical protein PLU91_07925, partial [Verrucomicrobiota bacterium]|nr:hypothetical protein [Verrucomicrobiota bacterium]
MQKKATQFLKDSIVRSANAATLGMSVWLLLDLLAVSKAHAQGTVWFANRIFDVQTTHVYAPLNARDTTAVVGRASDDTPTGTTDFAGRVLIGATGHGGLNGQYGAATTLAQLVMALGANAPESSLLPVGQTTTFRTGAAAGFNAVIVSTIYSIPTTPTPTPIGKDYTGPMTFSVVAWDNFSGLYPTWQEAKPAWEAGLIAAGMMTPFSMTSLGGFSAAQYLTQMGQNLTSFNLHFALRLEDHLVFVGETATFTAPLGYLGYQWEFNRTIIPGATNS